MEVAKPKMAIVNPKIKNLQNPIWKWNFVVVIVSSCK
jgi:hypothetical protein